MIETILEKIIKENDVMTLVHETDKAKWYTDGWTKACTEYLHEERRMAARLAMNLGAAVPNAVMYRVQLKKDDSWHFLVVWRDEILEAGPAGPGLSGALNMCDRLRLCTWADYN